MNLRRNPAKWARVGLCLALGAASLAVVDVAPASAVSSGPVVTNCDDSGPGSLRQAVADAAAGDTVTFALAPACSQITLTSDAIRSFFKDLTIAGPGASALAVSGNHEFTVFDTGGGGSSMTISGLTIENGRGGSSTGGGIAVNSGSLTLKDSVVTGNSNSLKGGGIDSSSGSASLTVINSTISNNTGVSGAGINASPAGVTVIGSTLTGNSGPSAQGGAIAGSGNVVVQSSTFIGNAGCAAGALYNRQGATQVSSSTFAGNRASCPTGGSAIVNGTGAVMTVSGSVFDSEGCSGAITDGGFNLDTGHECVTSTANRGLIDTPSGLDPDGLQSNGGPTRTIALQPGSAAIGLVDSAALCSTADQRGTARPTPICDAGAYQTPLPTLTIDDVSSNEGNAGTTTFTFTVSLSSPAKAGGVTFDIATADGGGSSPATQPSDYTPKSLTGRMIAAGSSSTTFDVLVKGDTTVEPSETFTVNVSSVTGATVGDAQGIGTIANDDQALGFRITTTSLPGATLGVAYSQPIMAAGGVAPYKWKKLSNLPKGLKLKASTGVLSGTPRKTRGTFTFTVQASYKTKAAKQPAVTHTATRTLSLTVS